MPYLDRIAVVYELSRAMELVVDELLTPDTTSMAATLAARHAHTAYLLLCGTQRSQIAPPIPDPELPSDS